MRSSLYGIRTQKEVEQILRCAAGIEKQKRRIVRKRIKCRGVDPLSLPITYRLSAHKEWKRELALNERALSLQERERARREKARITREKNRLSAWPQNKQRRSNIDWHSLVPKSIADKQCKYERGATIALMRAQGMSYTEIGRKFGVSGSRVTNLLDQYDRFRHISKGRSPAEVHLLAEQQSAMGLFQYSACFSAFCAAQPVKMRDWLYV